MNTWSRELSQSTSRQIAKQTSNFCDQQQIRESVCKIIRKWADEGASPFPISLGPIESDLTLFNLAPTKGETQECVDSSSHRLLLGAMSFILYCEPGLSLDSACDIYHRLVMTPIQDPTTNIRLAWAAAQLMTWLLSGLCRCSDDTCSCANPLTKETLLYLQEAQALMYCREQARRQDHATVFEQFQIGKTCFARPMACQLQCLMVGELGILRTHRTIHGDRMATVNFPTHGPLKILMDLSFINPLEVLANWTESGPKFTLGDKISSLATPVTHGVVHGFVTQTDGTSAVLIWSDTDRYVQYRPDQIQLGPLGPLVVDSSTPVTPGVGACLSGCTLLANASGGIPMREVRPGTFLLNAKGNLVKVSTTGMGFTLTNHHHIRNHGQIHRDTQGRWQLTHQADNMQWMVAADLSRHPTRTRHPHTIPVTRVFNLVLDPPGNVAILTPNLKVYISASLGYHMRYGNDPDDRI